MTVETLNLLLEVAKLPQYADMSITSIMGDTGFIYFYNSKENHFVVNTAWNLDEELSASPKVKLFLASKLYKLVYNGDY